VCRGRRIGERGAPARRSRRPIRTRSANPRRREIPPRSQPIQPLPPATKRRRGPRPVRIRFRQRLREQHAEQRLAHRRLDHAGRAGGERERRLEERHARTLPAPTMPSRRTTGCAYRRRARSAPGSASGVNSRGSASSIIGRENPVSAGKASAARRRSGRRHRESGVRRGPGSRRARRQSNAERSPAGPLEARASARPRARCSERATTEGCGPDALGAPCGR